ncbi:MAG: virulence RhuM family protein, partial [Victivallales bacterium]|nr:virulence RhuM family protein [Victivallales bacterium]
SMDYDPKSQTTREFFAKVQNKLHYAVHGHTAAGLIVARADAEKDHMGLTTWENAPNGKILKPDVSVAKNYLKETELEELGRIVNAYLDLAENRARRHIPMTMEDWARHLDRILMADDRELLQDAGQISAEVAKTFAEEEFEKFRVKQDRLYQSEFDLFLTEAVQNDAEEEK